MVFYTVLILIFIHIDAYISEAHSSVSWLDHVVCTGTSNRKIVSCSILDDLAFSDHIPLKIIYSYSCDADINSVPPNESACNTMPSVNWSSATDAQLLEYNLLSDILLSSTNINVDTFACNDEQCCNADHHSDIDSLYMHIVNSLFNSGIRIFGANERNHHRTVPGWNKHVAELHATARSCYVRWRNNCGKPHHGLEYYDMNSSRARFKLKFRDCLRNEDSMKSDAIALKLRNKEQGEFWRKVNALNNRKAPLANTVNGCTGSSDIAEMWRKHFMDLFNSVDNSTHKDYVMDRLSEVSDIQNISPDDIDNVLKQLKMGKSAGADHIHAEHLIHASDRLTVLLSILCTSIMKHGYIPSGMLDTTLSPIVKTKTGGVTDKNNYRPIAVATSMSKVMELLILSKTECFLNTSDNQFGFKKKHGTDMCIHAFRQTIE